MRARLISPKSEVRIFKSIGQVDDGANSGLWAWGEEGGTQSGSCPKPRPRSRQPAGRFPKGTEMSSRGRQPTERRAEMTADPAGVEQGSAGRPFNDATMGSFLGCQSRMRLVVRPLQGRCRRPRCSVGCTHGYSHCSPPGSGPGRVAARWADSIPRCDSRFPKGVNANSRGRQPRERSANTVARGGSRGMNVLWSWTNAIRPAFRRHVPPLQGGPHLAASTVGFTCGYSCCSPSANAAPQGQNMNSRGRQPTERPAKAADPGGVEQR
jgi:hypothetical protein